MSDLRKEAQDPTTPKERLAELAHLEGDRGDIDSDAGWCREYVAANINTPLATLQELAADMNDCMARRNAANNPALDEATLWLMIEDKDDLTADAARMRLRLGPKPRPNAAVRAVVIDPKTGETHPAELSVIQQLALSRAMRIPVIDPKTGRVIRPQG